jgi:hypothetical protein
MAGRHTLGAIIRAYRQRAVFRGVEEREGFANEPTLEAAVSRAGLAQHYDEKRERWVRYVHQHRIPARVLKVARERLMAAPLAGCQSFHDLLHQVEKAIGSVRGVGELLVYDTAFRIGAKLGLEPGRVYLHSGTRVGAQRLGLHTRAPWIERADLPPQLRRLPPWQVEDILCIYKDDFGDTLRSQTQGKEGYRPRRRTPRSRCASSSSSRFS